MNSTSPLVCNMSVFTQEQRDDHISKTLQLIQGVKHVREVVQGYEFIFPGETEFISRLAEFISNERLCCPFLNFTLTIAPDMEPIVLSLTGPAGTQEFLQAEFAGAIP